MYPNTELSTAVRLAVINEQARVDLNVFSQVVFEIIYGNAEWQKAGYLPLLAATVQNALTRRGSRQIINLPPRHLKSHIGVVAAIAWLMGRNPKLEIMISCHTDKLAQAHLNAIRRILKSERFIEIFGPVIEGKDTETEVETRGGGRIMAVSFQSAPTGRGCDILITDDSLRSDDANNIDAEARCYQFFQDSLITRLNEQGMKAVLVIGQRLSPGDLPGRLMDAGGYAQLSLPMVAMEREEMEVDGPYGVVRFEREVGEPLNPNMDMDQWKKEHSGMTDYTFSTQYQQQPRLPGGAIVKEVWLGSYDTLPSATRDGVIVQSWDTATSQAASASYSTCQTWLFCRDGFYLINCFRIRCDAGELIDHALSLAARHRPERVLVEPANIGPSLVSALRRSGFDAIEERASLSKIQRLESCLSAFSQMQVFLPKEAPWLSVYKDELLSFPGSKFNDQVDATTQFLNWAIPFFLEPRKQGSPFQRNLVTKGVSASPGYARVGRGHVPFGSSASDCHRPVPPLRPRRRW